MDWCLMPTIIVFQLYRVMVFGEYEMISEINLKWQALVKAHLHLDWEDFLLFFYAILCLYLNLGVESMYCVSMWLIDWLIDWCLTPTLAVFQRGVKWYDSNRYCLYPPQNIHCVYVKQFQIFLRINICDAIFNQLQIAMIHVHLEMFFASLYINSKVNIVKNNTMDMNTKLTYFKCGEHQNLNSSKVVITDSVYV